MRTQTEIKLNLEVLNKDLLTNLESIITDINEALDTQLEFTVTMQGPKVLITINNYEEDIFAFTLPESLTGLIYTKDVLESLIDGLERSKENSPPTLMEDHKDIVDHLNGILHVTKRVEQYSRPVEGHRFFVNPERLGELLSELDSLDVDLPIELEEGLSELDSGEIEVEELAKAYACGVDPFTQDLEQIIELAEEHSYQLIREVGKLYNNDMIVKLFENAYHGEHDSEEDFAQHQASELGQVKDNMAQYMDWEKYARDLFQDDYSYIEGHVFSSF